jgi:hypothetical protein
MTTGDAVRLLVGILRSRNLAGGNWRVRAMSNPVTIQTDLQGARSSHRGGLAMPEKQFLSHAKGADLWGGR